MNYRSSASFGKRQEFGAIAELLRRGFDVYMTLVDDQQIDCVVRQERDGALRYLDIQIKARSNVAKHRATFAAMEVRKPRPNFFFIFYAEVINTYWVIPSLQLLKLANVRKSGRVRVGIGLTFAIIQKLGGGHAQSLMHTRTRFISWSSPGIKSLLLIMIIVEEHKTYLRA